MTIRFRPTPWVFISSVGEECKPFRESATRAVLRSRFVPIRMETWSAEARSSYEACKRHLSECNVMILILTERYGSIHRETDKSYTEMEYDAASELGIPVLAFLSEKPCLPTDKLDPEDLERVKIFRERLGTSIQGRFKTDEQLEVLVLQSLQEWLRDLIETSMENDLKTQIRSDDPNIIGKEIIELDLAAFNRLQKIINTNWMQDFEYAQLNEPQYVRKAIRDHLIDYTYAAEKPENEFINQKVLQLHNEFLKSIMSFLKDIAVVTAYSDYQKDALVIRTKLDGQTRWIKDYDKNYRKEVEIIENRAESIIDNYKKFIRICRLEGVFK